MKARRLQAHQGTPRLCCPLEDSSSLPMVPLEILQEDLRRGGYLIKFKPKKGPVLGKIPTCFPQWESVLPDARCFHKSCSFWGFQEGSFEYEGWSSCKLLLCAPLSYAALA